MSTFIIAELSANHNHDLDLALRTIDAIAASGADAVKVQTYKPESLALNVDNVYFGPKQSGPWQGMRPWDLYQQGSLPYEWHAQLQQHAHNLGLVFFSSPFDLAAVDFLEDLDVPMYKIASFEITDIPLITKAAKTQKPIIISTGLATDEDIQHAVHACREVGNNDITLLKCTSQYPATVADANLATLAYLRDTFGVKVGLSDHTMGSVVATAAVALGAGVVEKHFILDRQQGGPDSGFSMEPAEFTELVNNIRAVEQALGKVLLEVSENDQLRRRSLFVVQDVRKGERLTEHNIRSLRPGHGLPPRYFTQVLADYAACDIAAGEPLRWEHLRDAAAKS